MFPFIFEKNCSSERLRDWPKARHPRVAQLKLTNFPTKLLFQKDSSRTLFKMPADAESILTHFVSYSSKDFQVTFKLRKNA